MTPAEAMERLDFHTRPEAGSFLDMLRPYRGLRDEVLVDVMDALRACAQVLSEQRVPRELMSAVWALSHLGRTWAVEPDGALRRNQLISDVDHRKLAAFLERFDFAVLILLAGGPAEEAFAG